MNKEKIGWDWPLVRMTRGPLKGKIFARGPQGQFVRVTSADVRREVVELANTIGPPTDGGDLSN